MPTCRPPIWGNIDTIVNAERTECPHAPDGEVLKKSHLALFVDVLVAPLRSPYIDAGANDEWDVYMNARSASNLTGYATSS